MFYRIAKDGYKFTLTELKRKPTVGNLSFTDISVIGNDFLELCSRSTTVPGYKTDFGETDGKNISIYSRIFNDYYNSDFNTDNGTNFSQTIAKSEVENQNIKSFLYIYPPNEIDFEYCGIMQYYTDGLFVKAKIINVFENDQVSNPSKWVRAFLKGSNMGFPGEPSKPDGGNGEMDNTSDNVDFPNAPIIANRGLISIFNPTDGELVELSEFLWSPGFIQKVSKFFQDTMDIIISLSYVPIEKIENVGSVDLKCGLISTGLTARLVKNQFMTYDFGSINIPEFWGNALDYSPYTKCSIYLPFLGIQQIETDRIMGKTISVKYNIDLLTGSSNIMLSDGDSVINCFNCNVATQIPFSSKNFNSFVSSLVSLSTGALVGGIAGATVSTMGIAGAVNNSKPVIEKGGRIDSSVGILGVLYPYFIIERPVQSRANKNNRFKGYPSNITKFLKDVKGYTEIDRIFLSNLSCLKEEQDELELLLKNGVYL